MVLVLAGSKAMAKRYFAQSPHGAKIDIKLGPALETLQTLDGPFDLIFIDADKVNDMNYYQRALDFVTDQGVILFDNVLWNGDAASSPG